MVPLRSGILILVIGIVSVSLFSFTYADESTEQTIDEVIYPGGMVMQPFNTSDIGTWKPQAFNSSDIPSMHPPNSSIPLPAGVSI